MKILILTLSTGQGHTQTAMAISDHFTGRGAECRVMDAYKETNHLLSDSLEKGYLVGTQYASGFYRTAYRLAEKSEQRSTHGVPLSRLANSMVGQKLLRSILDYNPDVIITTHLFPALHLTYMEEDLQHIPTFGIVTDFTMHPYWENTHLDHYVTASSLLNYQCFRKGIPEYKILPFGIPVQEKFSVSLSREEARSELGLENKTTVLVMMGSMGYGNIAKNIKKIDRIERDFQILCVCGRNNKAAREVENLETSHQVRVFGYVDNVDLLMDAADFMVTKPGGLTLSEALVKGIPVILMNPIPGHEDRNREFLVNNGLAMAVSSTCPVDEAVYQFLQNDWRRRNLHEGIRSISPRNPTKLLGDFVFEKYGNKEKLDANSEVY
ncbi:MAG: glycosyltransferase [Clostridia bacterium]|nr:glycosyltransferase [Clostridia bacterium]